MLNSNVFVTDDSGNIMIPCVLDELDVQFTGGDNRTVNLIPHFNWSTGYYVYPWRPSTGAGACETCTCRVDLTVSVQTVEIMDQVLTDSDSTWVNVIDNVPPTFTITASPYWAQVGQQVQITVCASEQLMNDRLTIEVKDSEGKVIPLSSGPVYEPESRCWVYQTEELTNSVAKGWATIIVNGVDKCSNPGSRVGHFKVIDGEPPDFWVHSEDEDIEFSNNNPELGEEIIISSVVQANPTNVETETDIPVTFYSQHIEESSRIVIGETQLTGSIPPDANDSVETPWKNAAKGIYIIEAELGPNYSDNNNGNNAATKAIVVGEQPFEAGFVVDYKRRLSRTVFEYECRVTLYNNSPVPVEVSQLELVEVSSNMNVIDPIITFNRDIDPNTSVTSDDTCTFEVDRFEAIDPAEIVWLITFNVEIEGIERTVQLKFWNVVIVEPPNLAKGDITGEGAIDTLDLLLLARDWLETDSLADIYPPPPDGDGIVDLADFAALAQHWTETTGQ